MACVWMSGCGGGGSGSTSSAANAGGTTTAAVTLVGVVAKGPLAGALVTAFPVSASGVVGTTELAHASTDSAGNYSLSVGSYAGVVQLVATAPAGATSADEASGKPVSLPASFTMHANTVVAAVAASQTQNASITAYTELASTIAAAAAGGATSSNIVNANGVVFTLIGMDPVATTPIAANQAPPAGATPVQKRYGLFNAAVSQLAASTPVTSDAATLACFSAAGANPGLRIQCATQQIGQAVSVSTGATVFDYGNPKLIGLSGALLAASASPTINQTGAAIVATDSYVQTLQAQEAAAAKGTPLPITPAPITQSGTDIATAKLFFSNLRANASELQNGPLSTGIVDGMNAFGNSLQGDFTSVTQNTVELMQLVKTAQGLWANYISGATTNPNSTSANNPGPYSGCTIYQGTLPTNIGGAAGAAGQPYVGTSVVATSPANASWVGCSDSASPLLSNGTPRYRQTILFGMGASTYPGTVPYTAITRSQYVNPADGLTYMKNLTATFTGQVGYALAAGQLVDQSLVGDLPPVTDAAGVLLAQRYPVNIVATYSQHASGANQAVFGSGKIGVVPVGGGASTLTIDLSSGGQSVAILPNDRSVAAQVAAAQVKLFATVTEPNGQLVGNFVVDQAYIDNANHLSYKHVRFDGSIAVAPVVSGTAGSNVTWLGATLDGTTTPNSDAGTLSFSGNLSLPSLPALVLQGSITKTAADTASLQASYVQAGLNVTITGTQTVAAGQAATFADASGVAVTVTSTGNTSNVTVSGRQTATIDKGSNMIHYSDGTFETLVNPGS